MNARSFEVADDHDRRLRRHRPRPGRGLRFTVLTSVLPAFVDVSRGNLRLLLSGPQSSAGRPKADGEKPGPGGWNRIHFVTDDLDADVERLRQAGVEFRNPMVSGPGGSQILALDPAGNLIELFQPATPR